MRFGTFSGMLPAGTVTTALPPGASALQRSKSASGGRWRSGFEKILCTVLHEAHRRQIEETMKTLEEGPEGFSTDN